jgi:hypothetical protein
MARIFSLLFIALLAVTVQISTANEALAWRGHRGAGVALGVGAGLATLFIISEAARAQGYRRGSRCRHLINRCDDGERWACRKFHQVCE